MQTRDYNPHYTQRPRLLLMSMRMQPKKQSVIKDKNHNNPTACHH